MNEVALWLSDEELAALDRFIAQHPRPLGRNVASRLLIRDGLIGMGLLALPRANRGKGNLRR